MSTFAAAARNQGQPASRLLPGLASCIVLIVLPPCLSILPSPVLAKDVHQPPHPFTVKTFVGANERWFTYPELTNPHTSNYSVPSLLEKPNVGIALSGGGFRAATLSLGWLRALTMLNITSAARYISSNSGATWLNSVYSFQSKYPIERLLGPYIPSQNLTMAVLEATANDNASFAATITNASIIMQGALGALRAALRPRRAQATIGAWATTIGRAFLEPYDLNHDDSTFTATGTAGTVHQQALQQLPPEVKVYTYQAGPGGVDPTGNPAGGRPFPLILGSILLTESNQGFFPIEFTPLYIGCPPAYTNTVPQLGGGFVDPLGFNSPAPEPKPAIPPQILAAFQASNASASNTSAANTSNPMGPQPPAPPEANPAAASPNSTAPAGRRKLLQGPAGATPPAAPANPTALAAAAPLPGALQPGGSPAAGAASTTAAAAPLPGAASRSSGGGGGAASVSAEQQQLNELVSVDVSVKPLYIVPLKVVTGISSSFLTVMYMPQTPSFRELTGTEVLNYWNNLNFTGGELPFADGGAIDNIVITLLLRRKVAKIISCVAAAKPSGTNTTAEDWATYQYDIAAPFGAVPVGNPAFKKGQVNGVPVEQFNRVLKVRGFDRTVDVRKNPGFRRHEEANEGRCSPRRATSSCLMQCRIPLRLGAQLTFHQATYMVETSPFQAIFGGWQVDVLWVINEVQRAWEAALPLETKQMLDNSRALGNDRGLRGVFTRLSEAASKGLAGRRELSNYPYIPTGNANYSPVLAGMLNQQATWQMLQLQPQLQQFLQGTNATGPT